MRGHQVSRYRVQGLGSGVKVRALLLGLLFQSIRMMAKEVEH